MWQNNLACPKNFGGSIRFLAVETILWGWSSNKIGELAGAAKLFKGGAWQCQGD